MAAAEKACLRVSWRRFERGGRCRLAVAVILGCVSLVISVGVSPVLAGGPNSSATQTRTTPLQRLWNQYPLRPAGAQAATPRGRTAEERSRARQSQSRRPASGGGRRSIYLLVAVVGGAAVLGVSLVLSLRSAPSLRGRSGRGRSVAWLHVRPAKGGSSMANLRRKKRVHTEANAPAERPDEQAAGDVGKSRDTIERLSAYSAKANEPVVAEPGVDERAEPGVDKEPNPAETDVSADLAFLGAEVGSVLTSAQEAAAKIRRAAREEAGRLRTEAESTAAAALDEARRVAEGERADGRRTRAEADAYAKDARAAADAFADQRRTKAEREARQIVDRAQKRLAAADAEVERKIRQAEANARQRRRALEAETDRYEKRLESILVVFQGMSSQLEDLLGKRRAESGDAAKVADEALEDALRPDRSSSRVG
jgi:hypothetical protein